MSDKLVKDQGGILAQRIEPTVISTVDPPSDWLLQARADINREEKLRDIIIEGKKAGKNNEELADTLGSRLALSWGDHAEEAYNAALYLLDEYEQLGEGIHLVSTETGKVLLTLTEKDVWDPGMVPREGGGMAQALPRIRPDLEAALTTWTFDRAREQKIVEALAAKGHQTALLRDEGDPRLLVATRKGRTKIVQNMVTFTPLELLQKCGGTSGAFLSYFDIQTEEPNDYTEMTLSGVLRSSSVMKVSDPTTINIQYNREAALRGVLAQGWVREIARELSYKVSKHFAGAEGLVPKPIESLTPEEAKSLKAKFWIVPPEAAPHMLRVRKDWTIMPVDQAQGMGFLGSRVGVLVVPKEFSAETNEMFEKWMVSAHLEYKLYVSWDTLCCMALEGLAYQGYVV